MNKRDELIKQALIEKVSGGLDNIYTADDILTVADISNEEMATFQDMVECEINELTKKKRNEK